MLKHEKYACLYLFKNPFLHNWVVDIEKNTYLLRCKMVILIEHVQYNIYYKKLY